MKLASATLALLCLAATTAAFDTPTRPDGCPALKMGRVDILGGKTIVQVYENIKTAGGCQWVLEGGTPSGYVLASGCARCSDAGSSTSCVGTGQMMAPGCSTVVGPDCRLHVVDPHNRQEVCRPPRFTPPPLPPSFTVV